jgi:TPP-dependent pyruvate/acetoin dehydrogenase alpha subunit
MCENNFYASGAGPMGRTVPTKYISEYTKGLGIPHALVDGNDVTAVYAAASDATEWARAGKGPSMIEGITFRWYDHNGFAGARPGVDGAFGLPYRSDDEVRAWISRDPIVRYKKWLLAKGLLTEAELQAVDKDVQKRVDASVEFARKSDAPAAEDGLKHTYAKENAMATQFLNRQGLVSHFA